jgi:hypothetical protein
VRPTSSSRVTLRMSAIRTRVSHLGSLRGRATSLGAVLDPSALDECVHELEDGTLVGGG